MTSAVERPDPSVGAVLRLAIGVGGLATCITLLFLGARAVMDVGGMCAEGGPYEIATTCPDGSIAATLLGVFGLFLFGAIAMWGGAQVGGAWTAVPMLAWTGLFGALGWNFLEYGIISPPPGETIVWGWLIPGVMFEAMAFGPLALGVVGLGLLGRRSSRPSAPVVPQPLAGPRQRDRSEAVSPSFAALEAREAAAARGAAALATSAPGRSNAPPAVATSDELTGIAAAMDAAVGNAEASTPADPAHRAESSVEPAGFTEETQALLDRLERMADLRDRGLLSVDEYETAKATIMQELEARS